MASISSPASLAQAPDRRIRGWAPEDNGLLLASIDPASAQTTAVSGTGILHVAKIWVPTTTTVANIRLVVPVVGATLTAGQNKAGIYSSSGTLIAQTADQAANWASGTGTKTMALTAEAGQSLTLTGGVGVWIYGALVSVGTTTPTFARTAAVEVLHTGLSAGEGWRGAYATAQTSLPASLPALTTSFATIHFIGLL